jgi:hypothetical protein
MEMTQPLRPGKNHDRIYTIILAVFSGLLVFSVIVMASMVSAPGLDEKARWVMTMTRNTEAFFLAMCVAVLVVRIFFPVHRKWVTFVFNILILLWFPFGTVFGIYGLLKVDKEIVALPKL